MNKTLIATAIALLTITTTGLLIADDDRNEREHEGREHEGFGLLRWFGENEGRRAYGAYLADPNHALYQQNCAECHMAYPPNMLPQASWQQLMNGLADHFGDNAELDRNNADKIQAYLDRHAAGPASGRYGERMGRATAGMAAPLRITDTDYFQAKHHEIPAKMVTDNPEIKSFSQCQACHPDAGKGDFDEHRVQIPGHGRWDD